MRRELRSGAGGRCESVEFGVLSLRWASGGDGLRDGEYGEHSVAGDYGADSRRTGDEESELWL